jgi:hypothetical protein
VSERERERERELASCLCPYNVKHVYMRQVCIYLSLFTMIIVRDLI